MSSCCQTPCVWAESLQELWQSGARSWRGPLEKFLFSTCVVTEPVSRGSYGGVSLHSLEPFRSSWGYQQAKGSTDARNHRHDTKNKNFFFFFFLETTGTIGELLTLWSFNIMGVRVTRWHAEPFFVCFDCYFCFYLALQMNNDRRKYQLDSSINGF